MFFFNPIGGAVARKRVRPIDKVAEGMSMFLAGPNPYASSVLENYCARTHNAHYHLVCQVDNDAM